VRKDSECTFGVLKARFRVLTSRIYRRNAIDVENMFKVCCCLHNMIMRARDVRPGTGYEYVQDTVHECNLDDGEDLRDTNARGERVRNLRSASIVDVDLDDVDDDDAHNTALRVDTSDEVDDVTAEELANKTALQHALMRHWRIYAELHREEYDGYHPFVYSGSRLERQRLDAINGGR